MKSYFKKFSIMFVMLLVLIGIDSIYSVNAFADVDSNTKLLMHMTNSDFKDECGHNVTNNNVTLDKNNAILGSNSANFNGINARLDIPDSNDFKFSNNIDFTVDFWVKWSNTNNSYQHIIGTKNGWSGCTGYIRIWGSNSGRVTSGKISIGREGADPELASNTTLTPNVWTHVAVVRSGQTLYIFINGKLDNMKTNSSTSYNFSNNGMQIGLSSWDGANGYFGGNLKELRISNCARWTSDFIPPTFSYGNNTITLDKSTINLNVNESQQLIATTTPAGAQVTWKSSDTSIATVDSTGKVIGVKEGTCTITATTSDGITATCVVTVIPKGTDPNPQPIDTEYITNIAHAKGDNTNNPSGEVTIIFHGTADTILSVVKTADVKDVWIGDNFTYTLVITNTGTKTAKAVVVNDPAPNHIDFNVSGVTTTQGTVDSSSTSKNIIVNVGDILPGGTVTIKIPSTVIA